MFWPVVQFSVSALFIFGAATFLVKFADQIADATKLGRLLVGSLFLAAATSLPELLVDINAVKDGFPDIGVGNVFGSCLFNLFILAIGDIFHKGSHTIFSRESAAHALSAAMSIMITSIAGIAIFLAPYLQSYSTGPVGLGTMAIVIFYIFGTRLIFFDQRISMTKTTVTTVENPGKVSIQRAFTGYFISATVILAAAPFLAEAAGEIAEKSGLGGTFVGTTLVSLATTL
ncbi:MAG: sodium:calcium antiporter, partial [Bacteriovoracia bacterium]